MLYPYLLVALKMKRKIQEAADNKSYYYYRIFFGFGPFLRYKIHPFSTVPASHGTVPLKLNMSRRQAWDKSAPPRNVPKWLWLGFVYSVGALRLSPSSAEDKCYRKWAAFPSFRSTSGREELRNSAAALFWCCFFFRRGLMVYVYTIKYIHLLMATSVSSVSSITSVSKRITSVSFFIKNWTIVKLRLQGEQSENGLNF